MNSRTTLSLDTLFFVVLIAAHLWIGQIAGLIPNNILSDAYLIPWLWNWFALPLVIAPLIVAMVAYIAADLFGGERGLRVRSFIALGTMAWFILMLALTAIYQRHARGEQFFIHDGAIQIEYAAQKLLAGINPYGARYFDTPLAQWAFRIGNLTDNPALYHLAYLPFLIIVSAPFELVARATIGWFDFRFLLVPLFFITVLLLLGATRNRAKNLALALLVALNPMFLPYLVEGRTDAFVLFWLVLAVFLLQRKHRLASLLALTAACASKQTAWFFAPFYLVYFLQPSASGAWRAAFASALTKFKSEFRLFAVALAFFALLVLPFLFWNANAFIGDVLRYPAGLGEHSYPINSLGFGGVALALGWIPDNLTHFPFEWLQLVFGLPTLFGLWRFQLKKNSVARLWLNYAFLFIVVGFFSNVFNDNHLGYAITLFGIGALWEEDEA